MRSVSNAQAGGSSLCAVSTRIEKCKVEKAENIPAGIENMAAELETTKKQNWLESTRAYLNDIRSEMKRVTWPNRERVQSTTMVVIVSVFIFAIYFKVVDTAIEKTVVSIEQRLTK